jgi:hypothetical protein
VTSSSGAAPGSSTVARAVGVTTPRTGGSGASSAREQRGGVEALAQPDDAVRQECGEPGGVEAVQRAPVELLQREDVRAGLAHERRDRARIGAAAREVDGQHPQARALRALGVAPPPTRATGRRAARPRRCARQSWRSYWR